MPQIRSDNHFITIDGETKTVAEWVKENEELGITKALFYSRVAAGWDEERAIMERPHKYRKYDNGCP